MNVLVLGAGGMAGHMISLFLREQGFAVSTLAAKNPFDANTHLINVFSDIHKLTDLLDNNDYDVVVNSIAVLVKPSEEKKDQAVYLNSYLPHFLEEYYKSSKTKIIHISSDGVFSGQHQPYYENSACDDLSFYGRSKALGEIINNKDVTFRLSIVGPTLVINGLGLFNWFYFQKGEVSGYTNTIWNGITTLELAKAVKAAIDSRIVGIYHLAPKETTSKFKLLELIKEVFDLQGVVVKPVDGERIDKTLYTSRDGFGFEVSDYPNMMREMRVWIEEHPALYEHYKK